LPQCGDRPAGLHLVLLALDRPPGHREQHERKAAIDPMIPRLCSRYVNVIEIARSAPRWYRRQRRPPKSWQKGSADWWRPRLLHCKNRDRKYRDRKSLDR
jgi:hypothetical protein